MCVNESPILEFFGGSKVHIKLVDSLHFFCVMLKRKVKRPFIETDPWLSFTYQYFIQMLIGYLKGNVFIIFKETFHLVEDFDL